MFSAHRMIIKSYGNLMKWSHLTDLWPLFQCPRSKLLGLLVVSLDGAQLVLQRLHLLPQGTSFSLMLQLLAPGCLHRHPQLVRPEAIHELEIKCTYIHIYLYTYIYIYIYIYIDSGKPLAGMCLSLHRLDVRLQTSFVCVCSQTARALAIRNSKSPAFGRLICIRICMCVHCMYS